jgi:hypothetical protein
VPSRCGGASQSKGGVLAAKGGEPVINVIAIDGGTLFDTPQNHVVGVIARHAVVSSLTMALRRLCIEDHLD